MFKTLLTLSVITTAVLTNQHSKYQQNMNDESTMFSGNIIFDTVIENMKHEEIGDKNLRAVSIPNIDKNLEAKWMFLQVGASLQATDGVLSDLTTLRRISDVTNETIGDYTYYSAVVTMDKLHVVFQHYKLKLGIIHKAGDMLTVDVGKNSFMVNFKVRFFWPDCHLTMEKLKLMESSDLRVEISGSSMFNFLTRHIVKWFMDYFKDMISEMTEVYGRDIVNYVIKEKRVCEALAGFHVWE